MKQVNRMKQVNFEYITYGILSVEDIVNTFNTYVVAHSILVISVLKVKN
jgi:hypothetical protein